MIREFQQVLTPIEIKSSSTFSVDWIKNIEKFCTEYLEKIGKKIVVYGGDKKFAFKDVQVQPFTEVNLNC